MYKCPHCGYPNIEKFDAFCSNCGQEPFNYCADRCDDSGEDHLLPPDACFCKFCGAQSTFMKDGYLNPKSYSNE